MTSELLAPAFIQEDNLFLFDYFSQYASLTSELNLGASADSLAQDLRATITLYHQNRLVSQKALLTDPHFLASEFFLAKLARYSKETITLNLTRLSTKRMIAASISELSLFSEELILLAKLHINRQIPVYRRLRFDSIKNAGEILVHFCELIERLACVLEGHYKEIDALIGSSLLHPQAKDTIIDEKFASYLGFGRVESNALWPTMDQTSILGVVSALEQFQQLCQNFLSFFDSKAKQDGILLALETLFSTLAAFRAIICAPFNQNLSLDNKRRLLLVRSKTVLKALSQTRIDLIAALRSIFAQKSSLAILDIELPMALRRSLREHLINKGIKPSEAKLSSKKLVYYLKRTKTGLTSLIESELKKIHPYFCSQSLSLIHKHSHTTTDGSETKAISLEAAKNLQIMTAQRLARIVMLSVAMLAIFASLGCGLKKKPQSSLEELKPSVPFHSQE